MVLESLIECYTHLESEQDRDDPDNSPAEKVRAELYEWRRTSVKRIDLISLIHQELAQSLHQFLHDSNRFQDATDRVHALMRTQQKAKNRAQVPTNNAHTQQEA